MTWSKPDDPNFNPAPGSVIEFIDGKIGLVLNTIERKEIEKAISMFSEEDRKRIWTEILIEGKIEIRAIAVSVHVTPDYKDYKDRGFADWVLDSPLRKLEAK